MCKPQLSFQGSPQDVEVVLPGSKKAGSEQELLHVTSQDRFYTRMCAFCCGILVGDQADSPNPKAV